MKSARRRYEARIKRQRELQLLGSHGAASGVRHIDPATYQPQQPHATERSVPRQNKTAALLKVADAILIADAKRLHGKRFSEQVQNKIATERYAFKLSATHPAKSSGGDYANLLCCINCESGKPREKFATEKMENSDGTEINRINKIGALRRTYAGVKRLLENKKIKSGRGEY